MSINPKDPSNFRQFIIDGPKQFKEGLRIAKNIKLNGTFKKVTISGMGGSALPANLLRTYCNDLFNNHKDYKPLDIVINRYYSLPPEAYDNCLNIISSYSGITEETISSFEEAYKNNLPIVGISSGGKIEELCKEHNVPHVKLPIPYQNFQPRMGTGYFFGSMFQILVNQNLIPDTTLEIEKTADLFNEKMDKWEKYGEALAKNLKGKTPIIYSSPKFKSVAMIWKIKINENAKTPAYWNFFPEADHNEMVGYTNPQGSFFMIMLKDKNDNPRNINRYDATAMLLKKKGINSEIIEMEGDSVFYKMFSSIYLADWTSYYLALIYEQDPTPVDMVEDLKKILSSK
ncbi:MAG TPA: bifunctional phosphoglucose/phosphomannose isomerase [Patescibacteria group bacterium]|nr:bifunctional phosphoglucose/phosphomannose isomerase [Patescibacteria group bacterium]